MDPPDAASRYGLIGDRTETTPTAETTRNMWNMCESALRQCLASET